MTAVSDVFSSVKLLRCRFHLAKNIKERLRNKKKYGIISADQKNFIYLCFKLLQETENNNQYKYV
jgi:transposase-like protein